MQKKLYLLCPTDCLESVIDNTFKTKNYFYTSLGNSVVLTTNTLDNLEGLIKKHDFKEICFVLSDKNHIINDALGNQDFIGIRGLNTFYREIIRQKEDSKTISCIDYNQFLILSYYLNSKIKELRYNLKETITQSINIKGKIYNSLDKTFKDIYPELICLDKYSLN